MEGIMVSAATGVMKPLLAKLTTLLGEEYKLKKKVKHDVAFLRDELSSMNALLETLADIEVLDPQQKEWRNQVREMAYDIEDSIDDYMHRLHLDSDKSNGIKGFFSEMIKKVKKLGACHDIAAQMRELKTRIVEASQRRDRYKLDAVLDSGSSDVVPIDPRLPVLYAEASSLIGIDVPRDELIKLVDDGEKSWKVVSIVGSGGLGKTTLANQVYQKLGEQFDCRAFVSVSQKPDTRKILRSILYQIGKQEYERTESGDEECIINALRDFLKDKRGVHGSTEGFRLDSWSSPAHLLRELGVGAWYLKGIPEWMASLANLTLLKISVNQVTQETFQILGDLPALLNLDLHSKANGPKERLVVCNGGFQRLKYFYLWALNMGPMFEAGAMPKLEELMFGTVVREVQSACGLGIHHLSALRKLCVEIVSRGARVEEVEAWKASIKNEANLLPNRPTPSFILLSGEDTKQQEEVPTQSLEAQPSSASTSAASN